MVEIIWHGHACFEVRGQKVTIVFDPFGGIGLPDPKAKADVVLCSHSHGDHNNAQPVLKEGGVTLEGFVGEKEISGISIKGISTVHDASGGSQRGKNSIHVVQLDGLKLCHLGDLGCDLLTEQERKIGDTDILFTPIAGGATIGPDVASLILSKLNPKIVLPMHYDPQSPGTPPWFPKAMPIAIEEFLKGRKNVEKRENSSLIVTKESLPQEQKIIVLRFPF